MCIFSDLKVICLCAKGQKAQKNLHFKKMPTYMKTKPECFYVSSVFSCE